MNDFVDRQYALEHYPHICRRTSCKDCPMHMKATDMGDSFTDCELELFLYNLPSVQPEPKWIPIEIKPPKEKKTYWICTDTGYQCECRWTNNRFGMIVSDEWGWSIFDTPQYTKVVAWMPLPELPEPYRKETADVEIC